MRLLAGLLVLLAAPAAGPCFAQAQAGAASAVPVDMPAEKVYANIKALTGVPYGEVIAGMQVMSEALGVNCEHCHSQSGDRDVEGHPNKDVARDMIRMVRDLNQRSFGGRNVIGCYTCHHGSAVPVAMPNLPGSLSDAGTPRPTAETAPSANSRSTAAATDASLPKMREVIDKYVSALGGAARLRANTSRLEQGTLTIRSAGNQTIPIEIISRAPDKRYTKGFSVSHLGNSAQAYGVVNGTQGWMRESNGPVRIMFGWRRDAAQLEDLLNLPLRMETLLRSLRVARREPTGAGANIVLAGRTGYLPLVEFYFDEASGLLTRTMYFVDTTAGRMPSRIDYSDYREVEGVKVPFHWEVTLVRGVRVAYQVTTAKQNAAIDARQFALPDPPPKLYR